MADESANGVTTARALERLRTEMASGLSAVNTNLGNLQGDVRDVARGQAELKVQVAVIQKVQEAEQQRAMEASRGIKANAEAIRSLEAAENKRDGALKATKVLAAMGIVAGGGSLVERIVAFFGALPPGVAE